jgi:hypothetical protein
VTADFREVESGLAMWVSYPNHLTMFAAARLLTPASPPPPLIDVMGHITPRPVLLITAGKVAEELRFAQAYQSAAPASTTVWTVEGADHTGGIEIAPDEWRRRVVTLLDDALG